MVMSARRPCHADGECGYAMVALLVAIALMTVFMSAALPAWRHAGQREREAELIWRGEQYDRAIQLYRQKNGVPGPPNLDVLVEQKFLRRKYLDPITRGEFELRTVGPAGMIVPENETQERRGGLASRRAARRSASEPGRSPGQLIGGVRSRSKDRSIRILNGRQRYNEWEFSYVPYQGNQSRPPAAAPTRPGATPRSPGARPSPRPGANPRGPLRPPVQEQ
jgi:type II secretory pathway pseudopilin PulG